MNEKALPELLNLVEASRDREDDSTGKNGGTSRGSNSTGKTVALVEELIALEKNGGTRGSSTDSWKE